MKKISIGRDASNQIILNDKFVSRKHAELVIMDNGQVMIRDLGSSNGTFVNSKRISESYIKAGDIVKCASLFVNWQQYVVSNIPAADNSYNPRPDSGGLSKPVPQPPFKSEPRENTSSVGSSQPVQQQQAIPSQHVQQNIFVMGKAKSVGVAFILSFLFGPLGLLYASVIGGIVMFLINLLFVFTFMWPLLIVSWIICIIWACIAADQANKNMVNAAGPLLQNQYRQ